VSGIRPALWIPCTAQASSLSEVSPLIPTEPMISPAASRISTPPGTGTIEIVRYSVVDDVGTVINPLLVYGQIIGGVAQGAGQILLEDIHFDADSGQLVSGSFMDYAMPRAEDIPSMAVGDHPSPAKSNPLGTKGCGEAGCAGSLATVTNAVLDALSEYGVTEIDMPLTPERIWRAIRNGKAQAA